MRPEPDATMPSSTSWPLWRFVLKGPSGSIPPQVVELRAPSEAIALDRLLHWRPDAAVERVERRYTP